MHARSEQDAMPCREADGESTMVTNPLSHLSIGGIDFASFVSVVFVFITLWFKSVNILAEIPWRIGPIPIVTRTSGPRVELTP
jgi:hypothetical protein